MKISSKQIGASLVEMMVGIAVGSILTAGLIQIVMNTRSSYQAQDSLTRLKENGRFARYIMQRDIRMAGFQGCNNTTSTAPKNLLKNPQTVQTFEANNIVYGYRGSGNNWSPRVPRWLSSNIPRGTSIVPGSDILTVRKLSNANNYLTAVMSNDADVITVADKLQISPQDVLFITDCEETNIFRASNGSNNTTIQHTTTDNISSSLSKAFGTDAYVGRFTTTTYYVRTTTRTNRSGRPINVLARQDINGNEEVLIEGIDNMKIVYGIDTNRDGAPDTFVPADTVEARNAWSDVVSIRISQLLNSIEEVGKTNQRYTFQGVTTAASDRMLRRQWDTFITLRNRAL